MSSGAGEEGWEGAAAYAAAKSGLAGLARSLAWELGREGSATGRSAHAG